MADAPSLAFREQLERVRPVPQVPEWERIATELRVLVEQVVHGDLQADALPAEMDRRADRMLEKRRWMLSRQAA
jgi:multiple sugar transport system substrate-binding protein